MNGHTELRTSLGAYVLGALDQDETAEIQEHLRGCAYCRTEYDRLAGLPGILQRIPAQAWRDDHPPELTLARILDRVRSERAEARRTARRRLWLAASVAAAAAAAVVGAVGVAWTQLGDPGTPVAGPSAVLTAPSWTLEGRSPNGSVHGRVKVVPVAWGSRLDVELEGVAPGRRCALRVIGTNGRTWNGGSWVVTNAPVLYWSGGVALADDDIARIEVVAANGQRLLTLRR